MALLDNFNRADENPLSLGGLWASRNTSFDLKLVSNQCAGAGGVALNSRYWTTKAASADCITSITVPTLGATDDYVRLWLRITNPGVAGETGYMMQWGPSDAPGVRIFKETARETFGTALAQDTTKHYVAGDTIAFEAVGTALTVYLNGVSVLTVTDSTFSAAGFFALGCRGVNVRLDDFNGPTQGNRVSQDAVEVLNAGASQARVSQEAVEVLNAGQGQARVSQEAVEVLRVANVTSAAVSQAAVEVLHQVVSPVAARLSQLAVEVLVRAQKGSLLSQTVTEVLRQSNVFGLGAGNGGEAFHILLAPAGTTETATLTSDMTSHTGTFTLSGDGSLPPLGGFCLLIEDEVVYVMQVSAGLYRALQRGMSGTTPAPHASGETVAWGDTYVMEVLSENDIAADFFDEDQDVLLPGWIIGVDSTQAYLGGNRYAAHVAELVGVFSPPGGGASKLDGPQPSATFVPEVTSENCPAALTVPGRMTEDISVGDVALLRYTNIEAAILELGSRSCLVQSWYSFVRVNDSNIDVTFTDPDGNIVDGVTDGEFHDVPFVTATLPGDDRTFTYGPPRFSDKGWPIAALGVRHGKRRVPHWTSPDWHNFGYVYSGFDEDATFVQILVNRNGLIFGPEPEVTLPGPQDIDGPNATWDDSSYYSSTAWGVYLFSGAYIFIGPSFNGSPESGGSSPPIGSVGPGTSAAPGGVTRPPEVFLEGGEGGGAELPGPGASEDFYVELV